MALPRRSPHGDTTVRVPSVRVSHTAHPLLERELLVWSFLEEFPLVAVPLGIAGVALVHAGYLREEHPIEVGLKEGVDNRAAYDVGVPGTQGLGDAVRDRVRERAPRTVVLGLLTAVGLRLVAGGLGL